MDEEKIVSNILTIDETVLYDCTDTEKLLILSNIILTISSKYFPAELQAHATSINSNGKSVAYELIKNPNNVGLNLAIKAHHIINLANSLGGYSE